MKCIKRHGEIRRVNEDLAKWLVNNKEWKYCPKSEWKENARDKKKTK